jgi:hypothetical protein
VLEDYGRSEYVLNHMFRNESLLVGYGFVCMGTYFIYLYDEENNFCCILVQHYRVKCSDRIFLFFWNKKVYVGTLSYYGPTLEELIYPKIWNSNKFVLMQAGAKPMTSLKQFMSYRTTMQLIISIFHSSTSFFYIYNSRNFEQPNYLDKVDQLTCFQTPPK